MYHFSDDELILFLEKAQTKVSDKIIFSELERNSLAYFLFKVGSIFLPFSKMVKQDGLKAVRRSFKKNELISICKRAGIDTYSVKWKWAFRLLVSIKLTQKQAVPH
jgi:2-polyprenyl-3-methyl-5-hydroxy-6-metoxy-1,4-benzoquinol methylase